jgi:hypothetical protein
MIRAKRRLFRNIVDYRGLHIALLRAHNPEVIGSSPIPATSKKPPNSGGFCDSCKKKWAHKWLKPY